MKDRTPRMSLAEYRRSVGLDEPIPAPPPLRKRSKYGAVRTVGTGGRTYASKGEAKAAARLDAERQAGELVAVVPQVSLPCGVDEKGRDVRYIADFMAVLDLAPEGYGPGAFVAVLLDHKGRDTPTSRAKRAALRQLYGLDVRLDRA